VSAAIAAAPIPFVQSGSYPVRGGNLISPLVDGEPAFRRVCEAIQNAQHSIWVTVTVMWPEFTMPDGLGTALDVLDRAAARGLDVRVLFWRPDQETSRYFRTAFWGSDEHLALLETRRSGIKARWDRAKTGYCQHQKGWLIDAGHDASLAILGGINLNPHSVVAPGHHGPDQNHDVYVELAGPCVADVHHNFVQRWNEASERDLPGGRWGAGSGGNLAFPVRTPSIRGDATAQVQRTIPGERYHDGHAAPGAQPFPIVRGEQSNLDQYVAAINAARHAIYMENQFLSVPEIIEALRGAVARGVESVVLMPAEPDEEVRTISSPERTAILATRAELGQFENFTLAGLAGLGTDGRRHAVYVHSKLMIVDDAWATVGSCNLHRYSLFGNGELNIAFAGEAPVRHLRDTLLGEHLGLDTTGMDGVSALRLLRQTALENARKQAAGDPAWQGLVHWIDPVTHVG
jgi:phosphatidylserine/phosphatidylglycerophosphate/cardiolipin synthase-like enzyme